jgi:hypothetical protein
MTPSSSHSVRVVEKDFGLAFVHFSLPAATLFV